LKKFSLFVAYSSKGIVILWGLIWAVLFFQEKIKINNIIGAVIIIIGIVLVSKNE
jgi:drug/metabolite transporter (DMT)-like permease